MTKRLAHGVLSGLIMGALAAQGGGLWLYERGAPDNMTAGAGRAASALDASTAASNPAGMTRLDQTEVVSGLQPVFIDAQFSPDANTTIAGDDGGQAGGFLPGGSFYAVVPVSDRLRLGWTVASAYAAQMDFGSSFVGRYTVIDESLLTLTTGPSVGYRVNDWLSIGAGALITYGTLEQNIAVPRSSAGDGRVTLEDQTVGYGGSLGVLVEPRKGTRLGLSYGSEIKLSFEDVASAHGLGPGMEWMLGRLGLAAGNLDMDMVVPQGVMSSVHQDLNERWTVLANLGWQDNSETGQMDLVVDGKETTLDRRFRDTYHGALGTRCRLNEQWTWGLGVAYDTSPVDDDDRTIDMPLDRHIRYATGAQYAMNERQTLGFAYTFVDLGEASVDQTYRNGGRVAGEFDKNFLHVITITWVMKL